MIEEFVELLRPDDAYAELGCGSRLRSRDSSVRDEQSNRAGDAAGNCDALSRSSLLECLATVSGASGDRHSIADAERLAQRPIIGKRWQVLAERGRALVACLAEQSGHDSFG